MTMADVEINNKIDVLRIDRREEFLSIIFTNYYKENGIKRYLCK